MLCNGVKKHKSAHRFAYELTFGAIPEGLLICHKCDVRDCVNPEHLYAGSYLDNMRDAKARGRLPTGDQHYLRIDSTSVRGSNNGCAKLCEEDIPLIVIMYMHGDSISSIARRFLTSRMTIHRVLDGSTWKHVWV